MLVFCDAGNVMAPTASLGKVTNTSEGDGRFMTEDDILQKEIAMQEVMHEIVLQSFVHSTQYFFLLICT